MKKGKGTKRERLKKIGVRTLIVSAAVILLTAVVTQVGQDIYSAAKNFLWPSQDPGRGLGLGRAELEAQVKEDLLYYPVVLATWPGRPVDGNDILRSLEDSVNKLNADPEFQQQHPEISASLWKTVGSAYLINLKLPDIPAKVRAALPFLRKSLEQNPDQELLRNSMAALEEAVSEDSIDMVKHFTALLQILKGDDPNIPSIVAMLVDGVKSPSFKAEQWLLYEATEEPIMACLKALQLWIKKDKDKEFKIETKTSQVGVDTYEVRVEVGPNVFLWEVNLADERFYPKDEFTSDYMRMHYKEPPASCPEWNAEQWLLYEATEKPIMAALKAAQEFLKEEVDKEFEIRKKTYQVDTDIYGVRVEIGPNVFLWEVNLADKRFSPKNEFTTKYMRRFFGDEVSRKRPQETDNETNKEETSKKVIAIREALESASERLSRWPEAPFDGAEILTALDPVKADANSIPGFSYLHSELNVEIWRITGAALLVEVPLFSSVENYFKARSFWRRSLDLNPNQPALSKGVSVLEKITEGEHTKWEEYWRALFEIMRVPDGKISDLVDAYAEMTPKLLKGKEKEE